MELCSPQATSRGARSDLKLSNIDSNIDTGLIPRPLNLSKIHRVSDIQLRKHFLVQRTPKLYVKIKIKDRNPKKPSKTEDIHGIGSRWDEEFTL
ncbi:hypothetical protein QCA50_012470 [Cerrena zonata]|uniref:C2 domain-containing protein n=1 Tax=Cerrena zonata TaxID=2478898 RepID=A0AAW0FTZ3_9APHY